MKLNFILHRIAEPGLTEEIYTAGILTVPVTRYAHLSINGKNTITHLGGVICFAPNADHLNIQSGWRFYRYKKL